MAVDIYLRTGVSVDGTPKRVAHNIVESDDLNSINTDIADHESRIQTLESSQSSNSTIIEEAVANVLNQDVNDADVVDIDITNALLEGNWQDATNGGIQYIGTPDKVRIDATVAQSIAQNANVQRPNPILNIEKLIGGAWSQVATSATGYIRDATDHEMSSNTIWYIDINPGSNPTYRLSSDQESSQGGVVTSFSGQFYLKATTNN